MWIKPHGICDSATFNDRVCDSLLESHHFCKYGPTIGCPMIHHDQSSIHPVGFIYQCALWSGENSSKDWLAHSIKDWSVPVFLQQKLKSYVERDMAEFGTGLRHYQF